MDYYKKPKKQNVWIDKKNTNNVENWRKPSKKSQKTECVD